MSQPSQNKPTARLSGFGTASPADGRRGFTAIEIAMVATVIAILALIVLPLFRNRVEESKIAAAKADLASFHKAETLAQADIGYYLRLEDLDNTQGNPYGTPNSNPPVNGIVLETPPFYYKKEAAANRRPLNLAEWRQLGGTEASPRLRGPYAAFQRSITYRDILDPDGYDKADRIVRSLMPTGYANRPWAPVWDIPATDARDTGIHDHLDNRIPIDPWGNPYLFFPATGETPYMNNIIYSMGPNGAPGDGDQEPNPAYYFRRVPNNPPDGDTLGEGDDLKVEF